MRLFAAVRPPVVELDRLAQHVDAGLATADVADALRRVVRAQWHLTTAFYGDVDERLVDELRERLGRAAGRTPSARLALRGAGTFPAQSTRARVLWVGVEGDVATLTRLADRCVAAGRRAGVDVDERSYRPHLTIARARRQPVDLRDVVAALSSYAGAPWHAASVELVHSTLGREPRHETIDEWPLSGH
ncbi:MAG: RNA 2',3'-cyclic phosphodiesterase [Frankiales bacterium]|nr:RNA 2',3'-cyclic phosphodiesterase [Frankiales bacterium]